jgi:hypothetical protein
VVHGYQLPLADVGEQDPHHADRKVKVGGQVSH